jgi:hypothetical protein
LIRGEVVEGNVLQVVSDERGVAVVRENICLIARVLGKRRKIETFRKVEMSSQQEVLQTGTGSCEHSV